MASATGWTIDYILNNVNYQTLIMMLSDAPRYIDTGGKSQEAEDTESSAEDEANEIVGFYKSELTK